MAFPIPAYCPHCGLVFSPIRLGGEALRIQFSGAILPCRRCGKEARLIDGAFKIFGGTVEILEAPWLTYDVLRKFEELSRAAKAGAISRDELFLRADEIHPRFGEQLREWAPLGLDLINTIMTALMLYLTWITAGASSDDDRFERLLQAMEQTTLEHQVSSSEPEASGSKQDDKEVKP